MAKNQPKKRNPFPYTAGFKRYHTYDFALRQRFGGKVARISLDGGFTCPNRDGTLGTGGCAFCSGSGAFLSFGAEGAHLSLRGARAAKRP